jgi:hypothetical protein
MQNAECRKRPKARYKPSAGHQLGRNMGVALLCSSCAPLVLLLCCSCFPLVLQWCPPPHHGGSVEPQVNIDCLGRLVIHMQSDSSTNPPRSAVLRPSRSKATPRQRQNVECRMQKGRARQPKTNTKRKQKAESRNGSCGSASPGHSFGKLPGGLPLQARTFRMPRRRSSLALGTMELDSTAERGTVHGP